MNYLCNRFQTALFILMCLASALTGVVVVIYSFAGYIPKYRCRIPYCDGPNATYFDQNGDVPPYVIQGIPSLRNRIRLLSSFTYFFDYSLQDLRFFLFLGIPQRSNSKNCTYLDIKGFDVRRLFIFIYIAMINFVIY